MSSTLRKAAQVYRSWTSLARIYGSYARAHSAPAQAVANHVSSNVDSARQARRSYQLLRDLYKLSKGKLSIIVMTTAAGGFVLGSGDTVDFVKMSWTCVGTLACSAAANTCNQIYEIQSDALMKRTALRPMPTGRVSVAAALAFAAATGVGGAIILQSQTNAITAGLGVANIALYASIYTPLKRIHPINTWVGAVVGAVPPLMGWAAASGSIEPGAMFLAAVLYFWQMPHFMALAWMCKEDYARGGHRMLSLADRTGRRTAGVAVRNALYLIPLGIMATSQGLVGPAFAYESVAVSGMFALSASAFLSKPSQQTARFLFKMSLLHLPLLMLLAVLHRQPNDGHLTWGALLQQAKQRAESAERRLLEHVHGSPADSEVDSMIFPFSPPLRMPCPYTALKVSLAPIALHSAAGAATPLTQGSADTATAPRHRRSGDVAEVS